MPEMRFMEYAEGLGYSASEIRALNAVRTCLLSKMNSMDKTSPNIRTKKYTGFGSCDDAAAKAGFPGEILSPGYKKNRVKDIRIKKIGTYKDARCMRNTDVYSEFPPDL